MSVTANSIENTADSTVERHELSGSGSGSGRDGRGAVPEVLASGRAARLFGPERVRRALRDGTWAQLRPGSPAPAGWAGDPLVRARAALLLAGPAAVLSGTTALTVHGIVHPGTGRINLLVPYDRQMRRRPGLCVRQGRIRESEVIELGGLRTQALDVALTEVLCREPERLAADSLRRALARYGPQTAEHLRAMVAERIARRPDRRGTRRAAAILALAVAGKPETVPAGPGQGPTFLQGRMRNFST